MGSVSLFIPIDRALPSAIHIDGVVDCCICNQGIDQSHVDQQEVVIATGKSKAYPAHVAHFYELNPATGKVDIPTADYDDNLKLFALAYGVGEGMQQPKRG